MLAPGNRTVRSVLRSVGRGGAPHFQNYHRVLNRARWSSRAASRILLGWLVPAFASCGPLLVGLDATIKRRWGQQIQARGIDRDPVRRSRSQRVKASGLRWVSLLLLGEIPWAGRVWALAFFTGLAPCERDHEKRHRRQKTRLDWGRQRWLPLRRWRPERAIVWVAESGSAALDLRGGLAKRRRSISGIPRLRLDAPRDAPARPRRKGQIGRPRRKGARGPSWQQRGTDPQSRWRTISVPHG